MIFKGLNGFPLESVETRERFRAQVVWDAPSRFRHTPRNGGYGIAVAADGNGIANRDSKLSASKNASRACGTDP